ncbi:hypothetical protein Dda_2139 [Drechslerella dactyloides]|uniref:Cas1p 10 TM acyl transferase domain-containing protein n=1 Tax=Drechslerella dactyloides TaxID=74499 RepID=A0AAD6NMQ5_DREDA|nr:hypothetical protein Dda_2139 [Drechslerella dactyloides]
MDGRQYSPAHLRPEILQASQGGVMSSATVFIPPATRASTDIPSGTTLKPRRKGDDGDEFAPVDLVTPVFHALAAFAVGVLVFLAVQRFLFDDARDPYKCAAVTNEGRWLESADPLGPPLRTWQPRGCMLHTYTGADIAACIPNRRLLFVGDHGIKAVFRALVHKFKPGAPPDLPSALNSPTDERDVFLEFGGSVTLEFIYDPFLNSSRLMTELHPWHNGSVSTSVSGYDAPAVFVVGAGIDFATYPPLDVNPQRQWHQAINTVAGHMRYGPRPTFLGGRDTILLAPVSHPAWEKLQPEVRGRLDPHLAIDTSRYLHELATVQGVDVLRAWQVLSDDPRVDSVAPNHAYNKWQSKSTADDGMTLLPEVAERRVDMVLNLRCNVVLAETGRRVASACCVRYRRPGWVQKLLVFAAMVLPVVRLWMWLFSSSKLHAVAPGGGLVKHIGQLCLVLVLCFYADRTPVFDKANKLMLSPTRIQSLLAGVGVFGVLTLRRPREGAPTREVEARIAGECRGVALAVYMLGSYLGATKMAEAAGCALLFIRVAEWTVGLLKDRGGGGAVSFVEELVRVNVLVAAVAVVMRDHYALFGLPAAFTFWYGVATATVRVSGGKNRVAAVFLLKLVVSAGLVVGIVSNKTLMASVWRIATAAGLGEWEVESVRRAVLRDAWLAYGGMAAGAIYIAASRMAVNHKGGDIMEKMAVGLAGVAMCCGCYLIVLQFDGSMYACLARMAMYAALRYAVGVFRRRQSLLLVWLGSLEAAVLALMPHAWLAANGEGVVDLGIWGGEEAGALWNAGIWTAAFVYVCWAVRDAGLAIAGSVMGPKEGGGWRLATAAAILWFVIIIQR